MAAVVLANVTVLVNVIVQALVPDPVPVVNQVAGGNFKASLWRVQIAPQAYLKDFDFEAKFTITSIQFSVLPKGGDYIGPFTINSPSGCRFTDNSDVAKYMSRAKQGDKIFIEAIKAKGPDGQTRTLNSLLFTLTN